MSTKIPALPLPLSPHHEQLPPLVSHYPRWSRNTPVTAANVILSDRSSSSEFDMTMKSTSNGAKTLKQADSKEKCTLEDSLAEPRQPSLDPYRRINQLELNLKSLQAQHLIMLTSLHDEIESLRQQNKELQFQLVFKKNGNTGASNPNKCSANSNSTVNESHLVDTGSDEEHEETLVRKLSTTLALLEEASAKNSSLTAIIEDQKLQIAQLSEKSDKAPRKESTSNEFKAIESQLKDELKSCLLQLDDAERLIQILRKENDEQQSEIKMLKNSSNKGNYSGRKNNRNHYQSSQRFPPLTHWQPQNKSNNGEWSSGRGNSNRSFLSSAESLDHHNYQMAVSLPQVQNYGGQNYYSNSNHHFYNQSRRGNQRGDDRNPNLHAQGFRKHLTGSRGMSQESN